MIAVAETGNNVFSVSLSEEDLAICRAMAACLRVDLKGVIAVSIANNMEAFLLTAGIMEKVDKRINKG